MVNAESINAPKEAGVPILMYHSISDQPFGIRSLSVRKADFAAQLNYLKQGGFKFLTVGELLKKGHFRKLVKMSIIENLK